MNKLTIIGNLTRDPELRTTSAGINVCDFTVAVNRRVRRDAQNAQPEADFFRVSAWRQLGENCAKFLAKGRKVYVEGTINASAYTGQQDGKPHASLELTADNVEFLSSRSDAGAEAAPAGNAPNPMETVPPTATNPSGFTQVETDELPF